MRGGLIVNNNVVSDFASEGVNKGGSRINMWERNWRLEVKSDATPRVRHPKLAQDSACFTNYKK